MKNLRRVLSFIMAAALSVSLLAVGASADGDTVTTATSALLDGNTLKVPVTYSMKASMTPQVVSFEYTMDKVTTGTANTTKGESVNVSTGPDLATTTVVFDNTSDTTYVNDEAGVLKKATKYAEFDLSALLGTDYGQGVYVYNLSETKTTNSVNTSIPADDTVYQIRIYVTSDANRNPVISAITAATVTDEGLGAKLATVGYNHGSSGTDLYIYSHVEGNFLDTDHPFTYTIDITADGAGDQGVLGGVQLTNGDTFKVDVYTYGEDGELHSETKTLTVGTQFEQQLKDGEYMVVKDLHVGTVFYVEQKVDDKYSTRNTYAFTGNDSNQSYSGDNTGNYKVTWDEDHVQIHDTSNVIDFYNKRDVVVDTGVNVEVYPCVLAMTMALCGGALLLAKKKESER
jgi:hypothetical protein